MDYSKIKGLNNIVNHTKTILGIQSYTFSELIEEICKIALEQRENFKFITEKYLDLAQRHYGVNLDKEDEVIKALEIYRNNFS